MLFLRILAGFINYDLNFIISILIIISRIEYQILNLIFGITILYEIEHIVTLPLDDYMHGHIIPFFSYHPHNLKRRF